LAWLRVAPVLFGLVLLAGCGQKGPLFLPEEKPPVVQPTAPPVTTAPAPERRDEEEKEEKPD
jgi:predicted small lipoprotein YifL